MSLRRTPLFEIYEAYGAKTVEFGGWEMPVQFSGILAEHEAVRTRGGLFDVSHMGEFEITGPDAIPFLQFLVTNDAARLSPGMAMYSPMVYDHGGCVDDLLVYCFSAERCWVVVNAGNIEKDFAWMSAHTDPFRVTLTNRSSDIALLALQGPRAQEVLQTITSSDLNEVGFYRFVETTVAGAPAVVSRTGYTGEDGFELYVEAAWAVPLWREILDAGQPFGILPCGLGCRDTLRLEARLPLYGHELAEDISPLEAGLGGFVKLDKGDFIGKDALARQKAEGVSRKVVGITMEGRGIPRQGYPVYHAGRQVGYVTSGTQSPTLQIPIGLVLVSADAAAVGSTLQVEIRGKQVPCRVVKTPFYKRAK
ncbi:glycine cleavage system aminomethyltransferase GcvT [Alicyclobacillus cycloheptanicus]|uniref:Aminomethyltransferase n=1 Tax=Alicyclobacillus cycloheptanicus TaxID=1457 RepID=A0ABT9XDT3_9BACL|nr:aminomethyltransferase [Alicyclobacillus cycloheptanicus]